MTLADTEALARDVALRLPHGALLILSGPLGAGKTTFTQALAAALGVTAPVTSPTYTLVHEYPSPTGTVVHIDAYRLRAGPDSPAGASKVASTGASALAGALLDDYLDRARLVVVEWGEDLTDAYPDAYWLELGFEGPTPGGASRAPGAPEPAMPAEPGRFARWRRAPG